MTKKDIQPRRGSIFGLKITNTIKNKTWLEGEEFAYPNGGYTRRAKVLMPDGTYKIIRCSIPDTFFSIPAKFFNKGKMITGFITIDDDEFKFNYDQKRR